MHMHTHISNFYSKTHHVFEFRPNALYFVFSSYKIVGYAHQEGTTTKKMVKVAQNAYAINSFNDDVIKASSIVTTSRVEYYKESTFVNKLTQFTYVTFVLIIFI